jgi:hypothetical protein
LEQTIKCNTLIEVTHTITSQANGKLFLPGEIIKTDKFSANAVIAEGNARYLTIGDIVARKTLNHIDLLKRALMEFDEEIKALL